MLKNPRGVIPRRPGLPGRRGICCFPGELRKADPSLRSGWQRKGLFQHPASGTGWRAGCELLRLLFVEVVVHFLAW